MNNYEQQHDTEAVRPKRTLKNFVSKVAGGLVVGVVSGAGAAYTRNTGMHISDIPHQWAFWVTAVPIVGGGVYLGLNPEAAAQFDQEIGEQTANQDVAMTQDTLSDARGVMGAIIEATE